MFNHTMVYDGIREADLTEACVELTVWDRDRLASNLLGGLRLGNGIGTGGKTQFNIKIHKLTTNVTHATAGTSHCYINKKTSFSGQNVE